MDEAAFHEYVRLFNEGSYDRLPSYYASDVRLELPAGRVLSGGAAIARFYSEAVAFREEYIRPDFLLVGSDKIAVEFHTEFRCIKDYAKFFAMPLQAGDIYVIRTFVLYTLVAGLFKTIRVAVQSSDASRVAAIAAGQRGS